MTTPYQEQWSRIYAFNKDGTLSAEDMMALAKRHHDWFLRQGIFDATPLMTQDLKAYADHLQQFGKTAMEQTA